VEQVRWLLETIGFEGERVRMVNISSAMGKQFADHVAELNQLIEQLGPNPLRTAAAVGDKKR
jgi:coenzyme F420-reducing hydrogenase delta subunit